MFAAVWGSPLVVDGKVYLGDEDGDVVVLQAGKEKKVLAEMNMGSAVYATPVPAHGTLFINNRNQLFALAAMTDEVAAHGRRHRAREGTERQRARRVCFVVFVRCRGARARSRRRRAPAPADDWPQFRGNARLTGVAAERAAGDADAALDLRSRRVDRVVGGDRRRRRLRRRRRTASCWPSTSHTGKLRWKYATGSLIGESSPAVGGGAGLHRRSRRHRARGERAPTAGGSGRSRPAARSSRRRSSSATWC